VITPVLFRQEMMSVLTATVILMSLPVWLMAAVSQPVVQVLVVIPLKALAQMSVQILIF